MWLYYTRSLSSWFLYIIICIMYPTTYIPVVKPFTKILIAKLVKGKMSYRDISE